MGISELLLVLFVALLVIKPKQLPRLIKQLARLVNKVRGVTEKVDQHLDNELKLDLLEKNKKKAKLADKHYQQHDK